MTWRRIALWLFLIVVAFSVSTWWIFRTDMRRIRAELAVGSEVIETPYGMVEVARWGEGLPALFIHGAGGGWDQGKLIAEHFIGEGFAWISVSRFGYLRSPLPDDASTAAQADAIAAALDTLGIGEIAVIGVSGGVPPALQLAARHPGKVSSLVLLSSAPFTPLTADSQDLPMPAWAYQALFSVDFPYWALTKLVPGKLGPVFDARPDLVASLSAEDAAFSKAMVHAFLPVTERVAGTRNEGAAIDPGAIYRLDRITAPTLVVHARDDGINPYPIAKYAAENIAGATLLGLDRGGHMMLGQTTAVRTAVRDFLSLHPAR